MIKSSLFGNSLIWFGAAVSVAEIVTGTLLAPLGFWKAVQAILLGHVIGGILLYFAGLIGQKYNVSAMDGVKYSFGIYGGILFSFLNLIQLVGWSAVMISAGSQSAHGIFSLSPWIWSCIIGGIIMIWIILKTTELKILNCAAVVMLSVLQGILSIIIFRNYDNDRIVLNHTLSFGEALELSIAMPLSWLPLIADYTCNSLKPKLTSAVSSFVYFAISSWMYVIGLGAALYVGETDISIILLKAGLGIPALIIVIFSTVTTTYLDVYSSEMSMMSITKKIPALLTGICVCILGVLLAIFCDVSKYESFLYWISSVFTPMIAIQITDFFIIKGGISRNQKYQLSNLSIWAVGFIIYRILLSVDLICGPSIPVIVITSIICIICHWHTRKKCSEIKILQKN